jgi:hypothetical protein
VPLLVFGGGGAALGALTGLAVKTDRFETVKSPTLHVSVAPLRRGAAAGFQLSF